jgi:hypothetical protein
VLIVFLSDYSIKTHINQYFEITEIVNILSLRDANGLSLEAIYL